MKHYLAFFLGSALLSSFNAAHAELIIHAGSASSSSNAAAVKPNYIPDANFQRCLANLRHQAVTSGVSGAVYDRYTQQLSPDYSVIDKLNYQPEFSTPIWDYLSGLVDNERVQMGQQKLQQHQNVLNRVEQAYGVPAETVESDCMRGDPAPPGLRVGQGLILHLDRLRSADRVDHGPMGCRIDATRWGGAES